MIGIAEVILPVFALIGLGYVLTRSGLLTAAGADGIMAFVFYLAAPCLLMRSLFDVDLSGAFDPALLATFFLPLGAMFAAAWIASRILWNRTPGEAVAIAFASAFGNTVMLGFPIAVRALGEDALASVVGIVGLHGPLLYVLGITLMEALRRDGAGLRRGAIRTLRTVSRNALLIGVALGAIGNLTGAAPLPAVLDRTTLYLAEAAVPAGLFAVGATLPRYRLRADLHIAGFACFLQLMAQPAATYALGRWVFELDPLLTAVATLIAAMPLGLNGYIFAAYYRRCDGIAASGIVLSNPTSILTVAFWLWIVQSL